MTKRFLPEWDGVLLALSERRHGGMSFNRQGFQEVTQNRQNFLAELGLEMSDCVGSELVHGNRVTLVHAGDRGRGCVSFDKRIEQTDALITAEPGIILTTTHADCAPIYFFSPEKRAVGLAHAGWRGIVAGLPGNVVQAMHSHFDCRPEELRIAIGPVICTRHYPVRTHIARRFEERFGGDVLLRVGKRIHLDLVRSIYLDFGSAGVPTENIESSKTCNYCELTLSSWRRDGNDMDPMLAIISLKS